MRPIKRLDIFILKAFLQLFAATFFICLFVFMMQYTWRYIDELIGKGLSTKILAQFFWYMGLMLVPAALPPGILLASLITYGNMGEKLELLSMKAAGIPLLRILLAPLTMVIGLTGGSFYFQNRVAPEATKQLGALVWSMKQASPELDIPEGIFYSEIPGYNIFVERKEPGTGMLYGVMIYSSDNTNDDTQIVLADSARLQSTADKMHLKLTLYNGERFRNMDARSANMMKAEMPYMRETFTHEVDMIPFDGNFNVLDASLFAGNAATKDLTNIRKGIDSISHRIDSTGMALYDMQLNGVMQRELAPGKSQKDSARIVAKAEETLPFDTLFRKLTNEEMQTTFRNATSKARQLKAEYEFRQLISDEDNRILRLHYVEQYKKFTISLSCLVFFFIGAPLGAIIRKGGLGMPVIVSVAIFIFYYIIDSSSVKMAKTGNWYIPIGVGMSTLVLAPIGAFLTYKANQDSVVFNIEGYRMFVMRLLGLRESRKLNRKEVIINSPDYERLATDLTQLQADCRNYISKRHLMRIPNYKRIFFDYEEDTEVIDINERLEAAIDELHNTTDRRLLALLNELPVLIPDAHTRPFRNARRNIAAGIFFPVGLFFFFRIWRYRVRLRHDLTVIVERGQQIIDRMGKIRNEK